jgi:hypothetical protein
MTSTATPTIIEIGREEARGSLRQRWSHYFVLIYAAVSLVIGINLRDSVLYATRQYVDVESGVRASYPQTWAIDSEGDYVFRVRDLSRVGFKTAIVVDTQPVSLSTTPRNLLDALSLDRAQTLGVYRILSIEDSVPLPDDTPATRMIYTYVDVETNPTLQTLPIIVEGLDVIAIREGQAIILSFLSDANTFESQLPVFERFLDALQF